MYVIILLLIHVCNDISYLPRVLNYPGLSMPVQSQNNNREVKSRGIWGVVHFIACPVCRLRLQEEEPLPRVQRDVNNLYLQVSPLEFQENYHALSQWLITDYFMIYVLTIFE